jgi:hypothetical protein
MSTLNLIIALAIAGTYAAIVLGMSYRNQPHCNHETWVQCTDCGTEYDRRTQDSCPECKCKNYTR